MKYYVTEFNPMSDWFLCVPYETLEKAQKAYDEKTPDMFEVVTLYRDEEEVMSKEGRRA